MACALTVAEQTSSSDLSFEVRRGETLVLLGRSGSGKTTTLKLINRLLEPTSGEMRVEGKSTTEWDAIDCVVTSVMSFRRRGCFLISLSSATSRWFLVWKAGQRIALASECDELLELVGLDPKFRSSLSARAFGRAAPARWRCAGACRRPARDT